MLAGRITWRELWDFVVHLPRGSATSRALYGEAAAWSVEAHLLAHLWDAYASTHTPQGKRAPTIPRPSPAPPPE